ncbi:MAG: hypothetical protein PF489_15520 [Salinivirgaceae bacterium]|jgi:hypothetical protein|nr:hypothetical protein [Salinivirgaceae bacterium]
MVHKNIILLATLLILSVLSIQAQVSITTLNGDIIKASSYKISEIDDFQEVMYQKNGKERSLGLETIFSIKEPDKSASIFYKPESDQELAVENMKSMVEGRIAGNVGDVFLPSFLLTFSATAATGFIESGQFFVAPVVPLCTTITIGLFSRKEKITEGDEFYREGFVEKRTRRRIKASLWGAAAGLVGSLAIHKIMY